MEKISNLQKIAMLMEIPVPQRIQLKLIELVGFLNKEINGKRIVKDLLDNYGDGGLWEACLMDSFIPLFKISGLPKDWNVDTLYVIPRKTKKAEENKNTEKELEKLAKTWQASEIKWIDEEKALLLMGKQCRILRIRWKMPPGSTQPIE